MAYSYDRRAVARADFKGLAQQLEAILQQGGYSRAKAKPFGQGVTISTTGGRADWMVTEMPGVGDLSGYIYFGPIPVQEHKAFVWVEDPSPQDRPKVFQQVLQAAKRKAPRGYRAAIQ